MRVNGVRDRALHVESSHELDLVWPIAVGGLAAGELCHGFEFVRD